MLQGRSLIGYCEGEIGPHSFQGIAAATGQPLTQRFYCASADEVDAAVRLAAQAAPIYAAQSGALHGAFLRAIATRLDDSIDALLAVVPQETGLPEARVRNELARTTGQLRLFAKVTERGDWVDARIASADPARIPPRPDLRSMLQAIGPVAVFGASNFPLAFSVAGGDTASALAAGCPVVVKAHPAHPATSELVGQAIVDAARALDMPEGVFSLLFDDGISIGQRLVRHPGIAAVGFTGSQRAGRALMDLAAARPVPIPVYAEMGSVNPVVVLPQALHARAEAIADALAASVSLGNGQFCTCPGLVLAIDGEDYVRLRDRLVQQLALKPAQPMLTPAIAGAFRDGVATQASREGVEWLLADHSEGGTIAPVALETNGANLLCRPALAHEVFGPATLLVHCADRTELLAVVAALEGQLTATLQAEVDELADWPELPALLARKAGRLLFGGMPTGVEVGHATVHGGPYPACSDSRTTSVGSAAITRFARPVCYQDWPDAQLPPALQAANPLQLWRLVDGEQQC